MSDGWDKWSMFVLKSIERIENAIMNMDKIIDTAVSRLNDKIDKRYDELDAKLETLRDEEQNTRLSVHGQKIKLGLLIAGISIVVSAITGLLVKRFL